MWSNFSSRWRPVTIGSPTENSAPGIVLLAYLVLMFPVLSVTGMLGFAGAVHGVGGAALRTVAVGVVAVGVLLAVRALARWNARPGFAEFDGQVIKQWKIDGGDSPDYYCVAIDAGSSDHAWAFSVGVAQYPVLVPGTFVHVRADPRRNRPLSIQPTEPPPVAPRLAGVNRLP